MGKQSLDKCNPLLFQIGAMICAPGKTIPVVGIPLLPFFAVEISVDGHAIRGFKLIYQFMGAGPISFGVPPKSL